MIKVTFKTVDKGMKKPEETIVNIFDGRYFVRYNVPNKAQTTVEQMKQDGRKGVLFSRGALIQIFPNKKEGEILEIVKKDIENGVLVAKKKTGKKLKVQDLVIEKK